MVNKLTFTIVLIFSMLLTLTSCSGDKQVDNLPSATQTTKAITQTSSEFTPDAEDLKRADLYIAALKEAFSKENGGSSFIAVNKETLTGLKKEESKEYILQSLKELSQKLYWLEDIKDNHDFFKFDASGRKLGTINGTVLSIAVKEYNNNAAIIEATSWFGNLGAVFPKFKATYINGIWQLELISMAVS